MRKSRCLYISLATSPEEKLKRESEDFLKWKDSNGKFADFHSQRATYITTLVNSAGANLKQAQILARHKDPTTTMRYIKTTDKELVQIVGNLPSLVTTTYAGKMPTTSDAPGYSLVTFANIWG